MKLVDRMQSELLVVEGCENPVLILLALFEHVDEVLVDVGQTEFGGVFNALQAEVFIHFYNQSWLAFIEKDGVGEDELTAFEFVGVWRQQMLHQPVEGLFLHIVVALSEFAGTQDLHGVSLAANVVSSLNLDPDLFLA